MVESADRAKAGLLSRLGADDGGGRSSLNVAMALFAMALHRDLSVSRDPGEG